MGEINIDQIEFIINSLKEVSDKVTICELDYYIMPVTVLDNTVSTLRKATHKD